MDKTTDTHYYEIAEHRLCIAVADTAVAPVELLPAMAAFECGTETDEGQLLTTLVVDDSLRPAAGRKLVRKFDTGNGDTVVYTLPDGGYQYIIRDITDGDCCLLITDADFSHCRCALNGDRTMRSFGLNNALMLVFAFAAARYDTLLIHASVAMLQDGGDGRPVAFPFTAPSGTGKSTHTALWLKHIEGAELLNDDNPVIRIMPDGKALIYGSPWSGKTPCYRQRKARLGAVTRIERAKTNSIGRMNTVEAFAILVTSCSTMKWDSNLSAMLCNTLSKLIAAVPVYTLYCLPDREAAVLSHKTLCQPWTRQ